MRPAPNLFDMGPSELAQDAFLSWLVAHAGVATRPDVHTAARAFIAMLWNAARPSDQVACEDIVLLTEPTRQKEKIDVNFSASVRGVPTMFVIEDKTDTSHHSNQLARYRKWTEEHYKDHEHVFVYLKTGFHFEEDEAARHHGYAVVTLRDVVECLGPHDVASDIFTEYVAHARKILEHRERTIASLAEPDGHTLLTHDFTQFTFVRKLRDVCTTSLGGVEIHRGRNIGGNPWTHLRFARFSDAYGTGRGEVLYHRVDARQDDHGVRRFYLCTRQYAQVKDDPAARKAKKERLGRYRQLFADACTATQTGLAFSAPSTDNLGANESEIGILFFDATTNSIDRVLAGMKDVHARFVSLVRSQSTPSPEANRPPAPRAGEESP